MSNLPTRTAEGNSVEHVRFYNDFVSRHADSEFGLVSPELQERVRTTPILFAGSGSVGGNMAMSLMEAGGETMTVCDPDVVGIENLAGQRFTYAQAVASRNKAVARSEMMHDVNPYASVTVVEEGITAENVEELVRANEIIVDGIDIGALDMIYLLHVEASRQRKPVIVGYDLAGTAMLIVYRYDLDDREPLDGELKPEKIEEFKAIKERYKRGELTKGDFLDWVYDAFAGPVPPMNVPVEYLESMINKPDGSTVTLQDPITPKVLGALFVETVRRILDGEAVNGCIYFDIPSAVRKKNPTILRKLSLMVRTLNVLKERKQRVSNL